MVHVDGCAHHYIANAARFIEHLRELDTEVEAAITSIPAERRILVTATTPLGIWAGDTASRWWRFFQGISTETQLLADVRSSADLLVEKPLARYLWRAACRREAFRPSSKERGSRGHAVEARRRVVFRLPGAQQNMPKATDRHGAAQRPGHHGGAAINCPTGTVSVRRRRLSNGPHQPCWEVAARSTRGHARRTALLRRRGPGRCFQPGREGRDNTCPTPNDVAIEVHDLTAAYRKKPVLWSVDFTLAQGPAHRFGRAQRRRQVHIAESDARPRARGVGLGERVFDKTGTGAKRRLIGYVPQRESVDWDFPTDAAGRGPDGAVRTASGPFLGGPAEGTWKSPWRASSK